MSLSFSALAKGLAEMRLFQKGHCIGTDFIFFLIEKNFFLIGGKLLYTVVLGFAIQQRKSVMTVYIHISPPS